MNDSLEARVARLEDFIGNIDEIRVYANSLQEVIDKYLAPLYIESGTDEVMLVDGYLGDLNNIPHNVIFKIRTSHDLVNVPVGGHAKIKFKRGTDETEYTLRKYVSGSLQPLEDYNYTSGNVYDIYINSQDVAIITANDTGVEALDAVTRLASVVSDNYNTLDNKIDTSLQTAKDYTDGKDTAMNGRVSALETKINPITKSGNKYIFPGDIETTGNIKAGSETITGNLTANNITANNNLQCKNFTATTAVSISGVSSFQLPNGCTISNPSSNLGIANKQWVESYVSNQINDFFTTHHYTGTGAASTEMANKPNNSFYYKLSQ